MKILHINDYFINSGAEQIYRNIYDNLGSEKIEINDFLYKNNFLKLINKFLFSFSLYFKIKDFIKIYQPEVILLHNINLSPFSVLFAIKSHKNVVQIVHDATQAGCPSGGCIYRKNYGKCDIKMNYKKCSQNCAFDKSQFSFFFYYFWLKLFLILKKRIIRKYISPSIALKNILIQNHFTNTINLGNTIKINETISYENKENILLYVGAIDKRKGIDKLLEAIDELDIIKEDWKFIIIGNGEIYEELKNKYTNVFYHFLGRLDNNQVLEYYKKSKIVFVPSLWFDNYPTVALEGIINNNIVLGSKNGGLIEIIGEGNIFNILDKESTKTKVLEVINNYDNYLQKSHIQKKDLITSMESYYYNLELELVK